MAEQPLFQGTTAARTSLAAETVFAGHGIVSRTLLATPSTRVVLFAFAEGQTLSEHSSPRAALVQLVTGSCEFTVSGNMHTLAAGDLLYLPPGAPHSVQARESFSMLLTLIKPEPPAAAA
jgi:quercetin dioxygenase-like cupin family protein